MVEVAVPPEEIPRADASVSTPVESKVDVAVPPKYAVPKLENKVEEAFENDCRAVHEFAFAVLRESVPATPPTSAPIVPLYESDPPIVADVVATFCTPLVPLPYKRLPEVNVA